MTSVRKIRANRANARASSGPKTAAGKAQSARNAFRHGFSVPIWLDPDLASDVEALAQRIVGKGADANVLQPARRVAEAQIDLRRVRAYRNWLIERAMPDPKVEAEVAESATRAPAALGLVAEFAKTLAALDRSLRPAKSSLGELARELAALDRYERRALSRRKFAVREVDLARVEAERRARDAGAARLGGVGKGACGMKPSRKTP